MKKFFLPILLGSIVLAVGSFYGGLVFAKNQVSIPKDFAGQFGTDKTLVDMNFQRLGGAGSRPNGEFSGGEILSIDEKSLVLKLSNGGSKIIYFSDSTEVAKTVTGLISDLTIGNQISVTGIVNDDGSITAKNIQILPVVPVKDVE